jgi:hypothetical protein
MREVDWIDSVHRVDAGLESWEARRRRQNRLKHKDKKSNSQILESSESLSFILEPLTFVL